jgi:hypothetical protein
MYILTYFCIYTHPTLWFSCACYLPFSSPPPHSYSPNSFRGNIWKSGYLKDKTWEVNIDMDLGTMICEVGGRSVEVVSGGGVEKRWDPQSIQ